MNKKLEGDENMGIEGIYERLISHWEKNGYKFFEEQDIHQAGKEDCEELYLNDPLEGEVKSQLANAVLEKLFADKAMATLFFLKAGAISGIGSVSSKTTVGSSLIL